MNYVRIENLNVQYGEKMIFQNVNLHINQGDKIALIAKNGSGKTTLLKMLFGQELPNSDAQFFIHSDIRVGYLPQEPEFDPQKTVKDQFFAHQSEVFNLIEQYQNALNTEDTNLLEKLMPEMDRLNAWDMESKVSQILGKLEITDLDQKMGTLSGGQKKRVAIAQILIEQPEMLLLDEPTNHLDPNMIEWLEGYLRKNDFTLFLITHDRYFMEAVCNQIIELDSGNLQKYSGNYADYLEKKQLQKEIAESNLDKAKNLYRKELEWIRRQPKARTTKAKSRIDRFESVKENASQRLEEDRMKLETNENRLGSKILEFKNATKSYGNKRILDNFTYKFKRYEKVGLIGKNGVGKSTFIKLILGQENLDSGDITLGDTVKIGYYSQENSVPADDSRLIDVVKESAHYIPLKGGKQYTAAQMLERFLFPSHQHYVMVRKLSGGERRRLALIKILMENPNFLILDEPTNDLDIITLNVLQEFLEEFEGCLLLVSHDRFFMDNCVEHLFVFEGEGKISDFYGTFTEYQLRQKELQKERQNAPKSPEIPKTAPTEVAQSSKISTTEQRKLSYNEQRALKKIETELPKLEAEKETLSARFNENLPFDEIQKISDKIAEIVEKIEAHTERWLELNT